MTEFSTLFINLDLFANKASRFRTGYRCFTFLLFFSSSFYTYNVYVLYILRRGVSADPARVPNRNRSRLRKLVASVSSEILTVLF